jgi:hypothetical protein
VWPVVIVSLVAQSAFEFRKGAQDFFGDSSTTATARDAKPTGDGPL